MNHLNRKDVKEALQYIFSVKIQGQDIEKLSPQSLTIVVGLLFKVYSQWPQHAHREERLASFRHWSGAFHAADNLVDAGFFCMGCGGDETVCIACNMGFREWESGDSPSDEHRTHSPVCPFLLVSDIIHQEMSTVDEVSVAECARRLEPLLSELDRFVQQSGDELIATREAGHSEDVVLLAACRHATVQGGILPDGPKSMLRSVLELEEEMSNCQNLTVPPMARLLKFWHEKTSASSATAKVTPYRRQRSNFTTVVNVEEASF